MYQERTFQGTPVQQGRLVADRWSPAGLEAGEHYVPMVARWLLASVFLVAAISQIVMWDTMIIQLAMRGVPLASKLLLLGILIELLGGLSLVLGVWARLGAGLLIALLLPTTIIFHDFWVLQGPALQAQLMDFMKNLALMGGLLLIVLRGSGPCSVDRWVLERWSGWA